MSNKIILNNGSEFEGKTMIMPGEVYLYFPNQRLKEIYPYVSVENNVSKITVINEETETEIEGYSNLVEIKQENPNLVSVGLMRG